MYVRTPTKLPLKSVPEIFNREKFGEEIFHEDVTPLIEKPGDHGWISVHDKSSFTFCEVLSVIRAT